MKEDKNHIFSIKSSQTAIISPRSVWLINKVTTHEDFLNLQNFPEISLGEAWALSTELDRHLYVSYKMNYNLGWTVKYIPIYSISKQ